MPIGNKRLDDLTVDQLEAVFAQGANNLAVLEALNAELNQRESDAAVNLQFQVVPALRKARAHAASARRNAPEPPGPVRAWISAFLEARQRTVPDGRHLYRYRMTDAEYKEASRLLRDLAGSGRLAHPDERAARLFVVFGAEWFRREAASPWGKWNDLAPDIFPDVPYQSKQHLTEMGLSYWRRPLRRSDNAREFLLSLALEGGIPINAIVEGGRSWLKDYLRTVMQRAITHKTLQLDDIAGIAGDESWRLRQSYRHDDFVALAAELAQRLLQWRKEAEDNARTVDALLYLDGRHPGWRDDLPVYVPTGETHARELISGLLNEKITGLATAGVGVKRFLVQARGAWKPAAQILVEGEIAQSSLQISGSLGNFRAVPMGELANHVSGDIALLEPPVGGQRTWRVTPLRNLRRPLVGFPFDKAVTVTLTNAGAAAALEWRGGRAVRSELLVFEEEPGSELGQKLLRLVRAGSVSAPATRLFALVPQSWKVTPATDDAIEGEEVLPERQRRLIVLTGTAHFENPQEPGTRFRVEPNTQARESELELLGTPARLESETYDLWESPVWLKVKEGVRTRAPSKGELFWRIPGGRWSEVVDKVDERGVVDLSWRDPATNIQLEKRRIGLVPPGARIHGRMSDAGKGEISLQGLAGWRASTADASVSVVQQEGDRLAVQFSGRPSYRVALQLKPPSGDPLDLLVPLTGRDASVVLADGSVVQPGRQIDLGMLRGALAVSPRKTALSAGLQGLRTAGLRHELNGELPLSSLRSAFAEMFAVSGSQDALVELEFTGDYRPPVRVSRYRQDNITREPTGDFRWHPSPASSLATPVALPLLEPRQESSLDQLPSGCWKLPDRCDGPCLVYLREAHEVVTRPLVVNVSGTAHINPGTLLYAITIAEWSVRQTAIDECLQSIGSAQASDSDLVWLLDLISNLNGLPATAVDALQRLSKAPASLVQLLLSARDDLERRLIWELQGELPFMWLGLPSIAWRTAVEAHFGALSRIFAASDETMRNELLASQARKKVEQLVGLEPALAPMLAMAGLPGQVRDEVPLKDLADAFIRSFRAIEDNAQIASTPGSGLSTQLLATGLLLPPEILRLDHQSFDGLMAPALLAAGALGKLSIDQELAVLVRRVVRDDPSYVSGAFPHFLKFYRNR